MEILSSKNFNTLGDCQALIDNNPEEIRTAIDMATKQPRVYKKMIKFGWHKLVKYPDPPLKTSLAKYQTLEDFQKLADNYETPSEFIKENKTISDRFFKLRQKGIISGELYFPKRRYNYYYGKFTQVWEFQEYIDNNNYESPAEFDKNSPALYKRLTSLGFAKKVVYKHRKSESLDDYSKYKNRGLEGIQDFIIKFNINSNVDFNKKASQLFRYYLKLRKETGKQVVFPSSGIVCSEEEWRALLDLLRYNIKFIPQYNIEGYSYYYDFYIPEYNIILEIHGGQHFDETAFPEYWNNKLGETILERDKAKNKVAKDKNIKIYYISYCAYKYYEKFGYFEKVYRSITELFTELNIKLVDDGNVSKRLLDLYPKNIIESINQILFSFRIYNLDELDKLPYLKQLVIEANIIDKLIFYSSFYEDNNEDVND